MTTQTQPQPVQPAEPVQPRPKRSGWSVAGIVVGAFLALGGAGLAIAGGGLMAVFGSDGTLNSGGHSISTPSTALVSSVADIDGTKELADVVGDSKVRLSVRSAQPVFVGIGPAQQVDRYLASAPIDEISNFDVDPFRMTHNPRGGSKLPAAPATQTFWVAKGSGHNAASLRWKIRDGKYRLVVMNADGSRGVYTRGNIGLTVPHMPGIAWSLIGGGLVLILGGASAIALGAKRPRRQV